MAFITSSNASRIIHRIDFKTIKSFKGEIYSQEIDLFSENERKRLLALSQLYSNPEDFEGSKYVKIENEDTKTYVFEGGQSAYHSRPNCGRLNSIFKNYEIPEEIIMRGNTEIVRFRSWIKNNKDLLNNPNLFAARLFGAFRIDTNLKALERGNSGIAGIDNLDLENLKMQIDKLLIDIQEYSDKASPRKKAIIDRFKTLTPFAYTNKPFPDKDYQFIKKNDSGYSDEILKKFLKEYHTKFKIPLQKLLIAYYRLKSNPKLKFEGYLLEQLGFKKCSHCYGDNIETDEF